MSLAIRGAFLRQKLFTVVLTTYSSSHRLSSLTQQTVRREMTNFFVGAFVGMALLALIAVVLTQVQVRGVR